MGQSLINDGIWNVLTCSRWYRNTHGTFSFQNHENNGSMELMGEERDDEEFDEHEDEDEDVL